MSQPIAKVKIIAPEHPHYGECGVFSGKIIKRLGKTMGEVRLDNCPHGISGCFVSQGQIEVIEIDATSL